MTEKQVIAAKVVDLAKSLALADNHFLASAVGRLSVRPAALSRQLATNGHELLFDADLVCEAFLKSKAAPSREYLHSILHCVFLHPYVGAVERRRRDLACDAAVEWVICETLGIEPEGPYRRRTPLNELAKACGGKLTAEKAYRLLGSGQWDDELDELEALCAADDHSCWYETRTATTQKKGSSSEKGVDSSAGNERADSPGGQGGESESQATRGRQPEPGSSDAPKRQLKANGTSEQGREAAASGSDKAGARDAARGNAPAPKASAEATGRLSDPRAAVEEEGWRRVAKSLSVNLQTYSRTSKGRVLKDLVDGLEDASRRRVSYAEFLRQFAVSGEVLKVSADEFDYVYYTYGLNLYGNLPLIEPLEYREEKRVREFVIAIDTSGSTWGSIVCKFVRKTYEILKSTEALFERVNIRILQCDTEVCADDKIANLSELDSWSRHFSVQGGGGTDFRPVFWHVDKLVEEGEFENLGGLVYFTDGYGTYPDWVPSYKTAFVLHKVSAANAWLFDGHDPDENVPPWGITIRLEDDELQGR